jgi:hypothetical protein
MSTDETGSVSQWIQGMKSPEATRRDEAVRRIWGRYSPRLLELARAHLNRRIRTRLDEEDVLQNAYTSACLQISRGRYAELVNRSQLWNLLITITLNKTRMAVRDQRRQKRDVRREAELQSDDSLNADQFSQLIERMEGRGPDPSEETVLLEEMERRLADLGPELRQIAEWKLEGFTNEEIAAPDKHDSTVRTVERKLNKIREMWSDFA